MPRARTVILTLTLLCEKALAWSVTPSNLVKQYGGSTLNTSTLKPKTSLDWTATWGIDATNGKIYFAIEAGTTGWVGLGLTEAAGMRGSDIMVAHVNASGTYVADYHAIGNQQPIMDGCQDWTIHHGEEAGGRTLVVVSRKLLTEDSNDRPILLTGLLRNGLLAAFGSSDSLTYHGTNKVKFTVNLNTGAAANQVDWSAAKAADSSLSFIELKANEGSSPTPGTTGRSYKAPQSGGQLLDTSRTMYWEYCFMDRASWDRTKFMTAFESVSDGSPANVHHFVLYGFDQDGCNKDGLETIVWVGGIGFYEDLPTGTALSFARIKSFRLQIHYDNPSGSASIRDNSGLRIWLSSQAPTHEAGTLQLGDGRIEKMFVQIPQGRSYWTWTCPSSETSSWPTDITVFGSILHMHEKGDMMYTQINAGNGNAVSKPNSVQYFDFAHQDPTLVEPYTIKRGDSLTTRCYFNNDRSASDTPLTFGLGSDQEMCIDFLYYYPYSPNIATHCDSSYDGMVQMSNASDAGFRTFGVDAGTPSDPSCTGGATLSVPATSPSPSPSPSPSWLKVWCSKQSVSYS
eukprot:TRINITY_DN7321_c1_g1_i8.p1 TRINITY_DN7321_c1_g1~~TRINITY_DN7321_c1_g1_i8.p1  ORF type:complete len:586 (-),score=69.76 TRINITY_DN7321_c1_g1_i8:680-2389(-)